MLPPIQKSAPTIHCISDLDEIQKRLQCSKSLIEGLVFERKGKEAGSNMTSWGLHQLVAAPQLFRLSKESGLIPVDSKFIDGPVRRLNLTLPLGQDSPEHAVVKAKWVKEVEDDGSGNNILGGNGRFYTKESRLAVPIIQATEEALSYYGATLLKERELVSFNIAPYPIWKMSIGEQYVADFLMSEQGGGFYVEYHNDKPHFHMPLSEDAGGFYLLGREVKKVEPSEEDSIFHFTGFQIPHGYAVYTSGGAIHCDAALTGRDWITGYTVAEDFSTVTLRSALSGAMVPVIARPLN